MSSSAPLGVMPRILIVRLSALGDVIHGAPVACALRDAFPQATIGWVVEGRTAELLEAHPAIDHVIRAPRGWLKSPRAVLALRRELRAHRFEIAIDLQCLTKSAIAATLSGAPRRIGKAGSDGRELSKFFHNELVAVGGEHVIDHYLEMLAPLGVTSPRVHFDLPERASDGSLAEQILHSEQLPRGRFAVLNPGAGWPSKIWPPERYGELARRLLSDLGIPTLAVWGLPDEKALAATIVRASAGAARLAPPTSVLELGAVCRRAGLFVGSDTGPMHLAVAVGTPTISLHGPSMANWCGAYGPENVRLQIRYEAGSAQQRRQADDSAMREISVEMVFAACRRLIETNHAQRCAS
ncbi:MAG: glycosyltransferase family 9 protein [Planctomycetaceae bacterium]|jgi:lipopolysaccharide heptosyltransferase I|nr:glycosyltransferase family 9 protein [Planctomycetaceae bacterium]